MAVPTTTNKDLKVGNLPDRVKSWIEQWAELNSWIKERADDPNADKATPDSRFATNKERRKELRVQIMQYLTNHPGKIEPAVAYGFTYQGVEDLEDQQTSGGTGTTTGNQTKNDGTGKVAGATSTASGGRDGRPRNGGGRTRTPGTDDDLLPGRRGADYRLIRTPDGRQYAVYRIRIGKNRFVRVGWKITDKIREANGISSGDGVRVTKDQFQGIHMFGTADQITRYNAGNLHPLKKHIRGLHELYGNVSWLKDKEYMGVVIMGFMEGWDKQELAQRLRRTGWYNERTTYKRRWEQALSEEDREQEIANQFALTKNYVQEAFGEDVPWKDHISEEQLAKWNLKVVSGAWGEPGKAWQRLQLRINNIAKKVPGTELYFDEQKEAEERRGWENEPELVFEELRKQALYYLGPGHTFDNSTLRAWARDIARERRSMGDWAAYIRKAKGHLHPWLDTEEAWQDRVGVFKAQAEQLMGRSLSWSDPLFRDLVAKKEDGTLINDGRQALSALEFERRIRGDDRYWSKNNAVGREEVYGLGNFLNQMFNGVPGGGFPATMGI